MARELENALTLPDASLKIKTQASAPAALHGSVLVLIQFDVCEEIRLDLLREIFSARTLEQPSFKHPAPGYVRYQRSAEDECELQWRGYLVCGLLLEKKKYSHVAP